MLTSPGNHEIESNVDTKKWGYGPNLNSTFSNFTFANTFCEYQSYSARFPNGQIAQSLFGDINSNMYYSVNVGGIHILTLNTLIPYQPGTPQYLFAVADLAAVNRYLAARGDAQLFCDPSSRSSLPFSRGWLWCTTCLSTTRRVELLIRALSAERLPKQYAVPFKTNECFRAIYETVYVNGGVDFVLYGHGA